MEKIIDIKNLIKNFQEINILNIEKMSIYKNDIYGFLGPNGAGKTTTMKLILKILKQNSGTIKFYNENNIKIGSLIEEPAFYENLTAMENLEVMRKLLKFPKDNILETLKLVGLDNEKNKLSKYYSLGMKQRLGLALALVNKPNLLILDEPTNGLDPQGIIEIRNLLKFLNEKQNVTILISSHQLNEINNLATRIGIINNGKIIFEGTRDDINSMSKVKIRVRIDDKERTLNILQKLNYNYSFDKDYIYTNKLNDLEMYNLIINFIQNNIEIYEIYSEIKNLENLYIDIISKGDKKNECFK